MRYQAEFDEASKVYWEEAAGPPPNPFRFQSAMFKDIPECWPMIRRAVHRAVRIGPGQLPLLENVEKEDASA